LRAVGLVVIPEPAPDLKRYRGAAMLLAIEGSRDAGMPALLAALFLFGRASWCERRCGATSARLADGLVAGSLDMSIANPAATERLDDSDVWRLLIQAAE
jgi:hypothetical protein